jgi:hypothetical protein
LLQVQAPSPSPSSAVPSSKPGQGKNSKVDPENSVISVFHKSVRDWFTDGEKLKDKLDEHERSAFWKSAKGMRCFVMPPSASSMLLTICSKLVASLLASHLMPSQTRIRCRPIDLYLRLLHHHLCMSVT